MADLNDPATAPQPDGGWSKRIRTVPKATIVPITEGYLVHHAGVYDDRGAFVHEAVLWRGRAMLVPGPVPELVQRLPGRWVWGGVMIGHFGHFLMESTGRLWALDAVRGATDGLVFVARGDVPTGDLAGFHRDFLDIFCPGVPVRVIREPTQVETLEVPGQGFGIGPLASGTDIFRDVMHRRFAARIAPRGSERLYISRSELGATLGSVLEEKRIERALAACGYDIFHPQHHTLAEQIARYKAARQVVALDGSALHLFAMVGRKDQQVAMIKRRISNGLNMIIRHLASFTGRDPLVLDVISRQWVRSDRRGADNFSFAELDFGKLAAALAEAGFVPNGLDWPTLTNDEALVAVAKIESQMDRKRLRFLPMPRGTMVPPTVSSKADAKIADPAFVEDKDVKRARRKARRAKRQAAADKRLQAMS